MDLFKEIGAILGFVAFAGLIVLVFVTFQQARHLRRLREWAGRSPERAEADAARSAGARGPEETLAAPGPEPASGEPAGPGPSHRLRGEVAYRYEELDRRLPVSPVVLFGGLLALLVAAIILTGGFGLFGSDSEPSGGKTPTTAQKPDKVEVAVLNGTAPAEGEVGVPGTAKAAAALVKDAGFKVGEVGDAPPFPSSTIMFESGFKSDAKDLADDLQGSLGETTTTAITPEIEEIAKGADLVLVVGLDDQGLAG
jgi:hypothetical protein